MLSNLQKTLLILFLILGLGSKIQAQVEKSRLNIGQTSKKITVSKLNIKPYTTVNNDLKRSYSQYYREKFTLNSFSKSENIGRSYVGDEPKLEKISISNIYPNPAAQFATIDFAINSKFGNADVAFFNILGKKVAEYEITSTIDKIKINVSSWEPGVYLYQLNIDGKKISTKKLLVNKQ